MNHELAKTLTTALVQFIDRERPEGSMCCSSYECERIEKAFEGGLFDVVEKTIKKKLSGLTEFEEKLVSFALQCGGQWDTASVEAEKWSRELIALAKKELARRDEVITLNNLPPYDKGFQDGKAEAMADLERTYFCNPDKLPKWLKDDIARKELNAHTKGYNMGYKDAEKRYNESVAYHYPDSVPPGVAYKSPQCYTDVLVTPNTNSGTSTATLHGNTSATDGKDHNPSFTD